MPPLSRRSLLHSSAALAALTALPTGVEAQAQPDTEWRGYANDLANTRYAPLDQIGAGNFNSLQVAWRFKTDSLGAHPEYSYEGTPLVIRGRLYCTAGARRDVVALDAATGELLWMHREDEGARGAAAPRQLSGRGVGYWTDGTVERILYVTAGYRLFSLDARTGIPDPGFGENGVIDLKKDDDQELDLVNADIGLHTAPTIARNVVIIGAAHTNGAVPKTHFNPKGYVRGFDVKTGKRLWIFHTIPKKGEFGYETWTTPGQAEVAGNTGDWAQISADEELGLCYLGVELPTGDYMGMYRHGAALFGESIVALDIQTGQRKWHYQTCHHGLWDRDIPAAAILCDIPRNGRIIKALALPTKQAFLFVLDRETGKPIWPIVEKPVPKGDVPGEWYAPTQPFPSKPPAFDRQGFTKDDLIDFTPELKARALEIFSHYRAGSMYQPPSVSTPESWGTLNLPGTQGGANWPGGCYDPETHIVYVYSKTQVQLLGLIPSTNPSVSDFAYVRGSTGEAVTPTVVMGAGGSSDTTPATTGAPAQARIRPGQVVIDGLPLIKPPYGRITALDLTDGSLLWQVAHGETPDNIKNHPLLKGVTIPRTGQAANLGTLVTRSLVICGDGGIYTDATGRKGARLRAYDKRTGEEKGAVFIAAAQTGSPMTYMLGGRQHIVVAIGGPGYSGELVAFRLPRV